MVISIICLILKCFNINGINKIYNVFDICDKDINVLVWFILNVLVYFGIFLKLLRNGLVKLLVICKEIFNNIENIKKIVIFFCLNSVNVCNFIVFINDFCFLLWFIGYLGKVSV